MVCHFFVSCSCLGIHAWVDQRCNTDWGAITFGSLDVSVRAVTCSPSALSSRGRCVSTSYIMPLGDGNGPIYARRCVLAVLTAHEVTLWEATKNHLQGEWSMASSLSNSASKIGGL